MSLNKKSETNYLVQGSILAIASIVSRIIGLVYRMPMTAIIGNHGNDYYSTAFEIYSMLLLISSYSLPMAVSKMVSARLANEEKENAFRVFKGAMIFAFLTGTAGCLFIFFGADFLTMVFKTPLAYLALRVLAPTLIVAALLGVMRGFFQGMGTMIPSAVSQIIEQVVNACVSVGAAYVLSVYGLRVAAVLGNKNISAAYGAAGGTAGTGFGALFGLAFMMFVLISFLPKLKKGIGKEKKTSKREPESYQSIFRILVLTIVPVLLSTTVYNLVSIVDQGVFKNLAGFQGFSANLVSDWWGIYSGKYRVLINVPIGIASALSVSAVPTLAAAFSKGDTEQVKRRISLSMRFIMVIAFPCTAGLIVLASPIQQLLFHDATEMSARLLQVGAICVIFYAISTLSNAVLQAIDRMQIPVRNAVISLAVQAIVLIGVMLATPAGIYAVIIANLVFSLLMSILNGTSVRRYSGFRPDIDKTFIKPAIASVVMAIMVLLSYIFIHRAFHSNFIASVLAICVGVIIYPSVLLKTKGLTENELRQFPKGTILIRIFRKLHLL